MEKEKEFLIHSDFSDQNHLSFQSLSQFIFLLCNSAVIIIYLYII